MSATAVRVDRLSIQERVLDIAQQLLDELGSHRGLEEIRSAAHAESVQALHLERDLGLGSLERVELIVRSGDAFHIRPPDELFAEANTVGDVIAALELQLGQARKHRARKRGSLAHGANDLEILQRVGGRLWRDKGLIEDGDVDAIADFRPVGDGKSKIEVVIENCTAQPRHWEFHSWLS